MADGSLKVRLRETNRKRLVIIRLAVKKDITVAIYLNIVIAMSMSPGESC